LFGRRLGGERDGKFSLRRQLELIKWRRPIDAASSAPFRLCLRLEEPQAAAGKNADRWRIEYLLQAIDDLSLLIPAEAAWKGKGREALILERDGFRPREYLLSALGQAAAL
jgi:hypothetical protein